MGRDNADNDSSPIFVHNQTSNPTTIADINVPANAKVKILQMFLKKFAYISVTQVMESILDVIHIQS